MINASDSAVAAAIREQIARLTEENADLKMETERLKADRVQLESLCMTDPLTGLLNLRGFDGRGRESMSVIRRTLKDGGAMKGVLTYLDLDHFKSVNDHPELGHGYGDTLLKLLASVINSLTRASDIKARVGGDEFVILSQGITIEDMVELVRRIRSCFLREVSDIIPKTVSIPLDISAGLYSFTDGTFRIWGHLKEYLNESPESLLGKITREAEICLREAKRRGKNRVCWAVLDNDDQKFRERIFSP